MQCQRVNFTTQLSCGLIKRLPWYSSHQIYLRFVTAIKKSHELCHVHHMQSIDLSVCTYAVCVCMCATAHVHDGFFATVCTDESFSYQRIYSSAINDCSHFASLPPQGYYCCSTPDVLEVTAGHYTSEEEDLPTHVAPVYKGEIYLSLSCCLGPDQGTLTHASWTLWILYNLKWKWEKCSCFTWHYALSGPVPFWLGSQCLVVRNSVLLGAPPDIENQGVSKLACASQGGVKWLSACRYLFLRQCLQRTSFSQPLAKQIRKEQKGNISLRNKIWGDQEKVRNYANQL